MAKALLFSFDEQDGYTKRTFVWFKFFLLSHFPSHMKVLTLALWAFFEEEAPSIRFFMLLAWPYIWIHFWLIQGNEVWRESRLIAESMSCYHLIVARVLNKTFLGMKECGFHHDLDDWQPLRSFKPTWARGFQSLPTSPKADVSIFHSLQHQHYGNEPWSILKLESHG